MLRAALAVGVVVVAVVVGVVFGWAYAAFIIFIAVAVVAPFVLLSRESEGYRAWSQKLYGNERD
jgi:hypothetical protein